jgi:hypothetical protein
MHVSWSTVGSSRWTSPARRADRRGIVALDAFEVDRTPFRDGGGITSLSPFPRGKTEVKLRILAR